MQKSITHICLKVNKPRQNETNTGEGEKYNFYVHSDIKEKVVIINITPTYAADYHSPHGPFATCLHILWTNYSHQLALHAYNE